MRLFTVFLLWGHLIKYCSANEDWDLLWSQDPSTLDPLTFISSTTDFHPKDAFNSVDQFHVQVPHVPATGKGSTVQRIKWGDPQECYDRELRLSYFRTWCDQNPVSCMRTIHGHNPNELAVMIYECHNGKHYTNIVSPLDKDLDAPECHRYELNFLDRWCTENPISCRHKDVIFSERLRLSLITCHNNNTYLKIAAPLDDRKELKRPNTPVKLKCTEDYSDQYAPWDVIGVIC
jgi:hypothetical protein